MNFGASDVLMQQIVKGAPADVFASADQKAMDKAVDEKVIATDSRRDFAANSLVLIVPKDSTFAPASVKDLTAASVKRVAYGDPASVPVGRYTEGALKEAGVWDAVSAKGVLAANVRQSLDYVARGEADAGFVFGTDAAAGHAAHRARLLPARVTRPARRDRGVARQVRHPVGVHLARRGDRVRRGRISARA